MNAERATLTEQELNRWRTEAEHAAAGGWDYAPRILRLIDALREAGERERDRLMALATALQNEADATPRRSVALGLRRASNRVLTLIDRGEGA